MCELRVEFFYDTTTYGTMCDTQCFTQLIKA